MRSLLTALVTAAALAFPAQAEEHSPPSIRITGTGSVSARPDTAHISVGVVTQDEHATEALKKNNAAMDRLLGVVKAKGIAERDIQTSQFYVTPLYKRDKTGREAPVIVGYRVSNQVQLRVRQLTLLGGLLDEVVKSGANQLHGIRFSVAETTKLLDEARKNAVADAQRKAQLYAKACGVKLGRLLLIEEQMSSVPRPVFYRAADMEMKGAPIEPGEQKLQISIRINYALE